MLQVIYVVGALLLLSAAHSYLGRYLRSDTYDNAYVTGHFRSPHEHETQHFRFLDNDVTGHFRSLADDVIVIGHFRSQDNDATSN